MRAGHTALLVFGLLLLPGCTAPGPAWTPEGADFASEGPEPASLGDDAVVVAVLDPSPLNPYHPEWRMNLTQDPREWLAGFPQDPTFSSIAPLALTLNDDPDTPGSQLAAADAEQWSAMQPSAAGSIHYRYVPHTKIIGLLDFHHGDIAGDSTSHGSRAASAAVGGWFGTCPECLLVYIRPGDTEAAINWALDQPWIDVISASYGTSELDRTFIYRGCDLERQRIASERGQTLFWTASNGLVAGQVPGLTLQSCQFGPDWVVTVGGISPGGGSQFWAGKPVDIAGPSEDYPTQGGTFGGTSAATPVAAGVYARALALARIAMPGPSRIQSDGTIGTAPGGICGSTALGCALEDGSLTASELRAAYFGEAQHTAAGMKVIQQGPALPPLPEQEFAAEGHGSYLGRTHDAWNTEASAILAVLTGAQAPRERPQGEAAWFRADSQCRQSIWGEWSGGPYVAGQTPEPGPDPLWPLRTSLLVVCPALATVLWAG